MVSRVAQKRRLGMRTPLALCLIDGRQKRNPWPVNLSHRESTQNSCKMVLWGTITIFRENFREIFDKCSTEDIDWRFLAGISCQSVRYKDMRLHCILYKNTHFLPPFCAPFRDIGRKIQTLLPTWIWRSRSKWPRWSFIKYIAVRELDYLGYHPYASYRPNGRNEGLIMGRFLHFNENNWNERRK